MKKIPTNYLFAILFAFGLIAGCSSNTPLTDAGKADEVIAFIDLDRFDRELAQSLGSPLAQVNVPFLDRVSPNQMPERLKTWLNEVEKSGGKVLVQEPVNTSGVTAKNPYLLLTIINAIQSIGDLSKKSKESKSVFANAKNHDVKIFLTHNSNDEVVIEKIVFAKKQSKP